MARVTAVNWAASRPWTIALMRWSRPAWLVSRESRDYSVNRLSLRLRLRPDTRSHGCACDPSDGDSHGEVFPPVRRDEGNE